MPKHAEPDSPGYQQILTSSQPAREIDLLRKDIDTRLQVLTYDGRRFVPKRALQEYFTKDKIRTFLDLYHVPRHRWEAISNDYLAVFVVLLLIGNGNFITFFLPYDYLSDSHLPFNNPENWPGRCQHLHKEFEKMQWVFCPQELRSGRLDDKRFDPKMVIPITSSEELNIGSDSKTYKVIIHPDYNLLTPKAANKTLLPRYFVLKSCDAKHADLYENEVRAYRTLGQHKVISNNIAKFYGSWKQGNTYNILLEYVDGGPHGNTLKELFEGEHPTQETDCVKLWFKLVELTQVLCHIHCHRDPENRSQVAYGVHQDIKSDNILVSQTDATSLFDCIFKLADLGLTYFPKAVQQDRINRGRDRPGTQMYSAPECFRDEFDPFDQRTMREANPKKDIWSLGCVFSEALVWSVLGRIALQEYRQLRKDATNRIANMKKTAYSGSFHDGKNVSSAVRDMHDRVRAVHCPVYDIIPVIEDMLDGNLQQRPDAPTVRRRLLQALDTAKRIYGEDVYPTPFQDRDEPISSPQPSHRTQPRTDTFDGMCASPKSLSHFEGARFGAESSQISPEPGIFSGPGMIGHGHIFDNSRSSHNPGKPKRRATEGEAPTFSPKLHITSRLSAPRGQDFLSRSKNSIPGHALASDTRPLGSSQAQLTSPSIDRNGTINMANLDLKADREPFTPRSTSSPHATIRQVLAWISEKKKTSSVPCAVPLSNAYLAHLKGKDQIFIIDNSSSMQQYQRELRETFQALSYVVKRLDPDGIDMYFTTSREKGHETHREKLLTRLDNVKYEAQTTMELTLSRVLNSKKKKHWSRPFHNRDNSEGKSIYFLTDGKWHGNDGSLCGIPELIKRKVEELGSRAKLGIQFIQFGHDPVGTWRLKMLDDGLKAYGVKMDVIDTERHDGNVYKMLLGHLDSSWDQLNAASSDGSQQSSNRPSNSS